MLVAGDRLPLQSFAAAPHVQQSSILSHHSFASKRSLVVWPAPGARHCLWTHRFSWIVRFGWVNVLTRFHLVFSSPFSTIISLELTPLFAPQIVHSIYPKSSCCEVCFLPLFGFWRGSMTWMGDLRRMSVGAALGNPPTLSPFLLHMVYGLQKWICSGASGTLM